MVENEEYVFKSEFIMTFITFYTGLGYENESNRILPKGFHSDAARFHLSIF